MLSDGEMLTKAIKAANKAYNLVIIDNMKCELYEKYNINTWKTTTQHGMNKGQSKSKEELNEELVNAIAIEMAKPRLKEG